MQLCPRSHYFFNVRWCSQPWKPISQVRARSVQLFAGQRLGLPMSEVFNTMVWSLFGIFRLGDSEVQTPPHPCYTVIALDPSVPRFAAVCHSSSEVTTAELNLAFPNQMHLQYYCVK